MSLIEGRDGDVSHPGDPPSSRSIEDTLKERGVNYGCFPTQAKITQNIKAAMQDSPNWPDLTADMRESLEMVAHKIGRVLNGNPFYHDSWHDMIGYLTLVENEYWDKEGKIR